MLPGTVTWLALILGVVRAEFLSAFVQPAAHEEKASHNPVSLLKLGKPLVGDEVLADGLEARTTHTYANLWLNAHILLVWHFLSSITFSMIIKVLCVTGNVMVQVSPFSQVRRWEDRGDTGGADSAPYVSIAFGGWQWCFYGLFAWTTTGRNGFLVLLQSNSLGAVLGTYYTFTFYRQCRSAAARTSLERYLCFAGGLALFEACVVALLPARRALPIVGLISAFCGFVSASSVLVTVPLVVVKRDSRSIAGPLVTASAVTCLLWTICGLLLEDNLITAPSFAGLLANSVCVCLKMLYPSREGDEANVTAKEDSSTKLPCAVAHHEDPVGDLRSKLRERMEQRWHTALLMKSLRNASTPAEETSLLAKDSSSAFCSVAASAADKGKREGTGGTS